MNNAIWPTICLLVLFLIGLSFFCSCSKPLSKYYPDDHMENNGNFEEVYNGIPLNWLVYTEETTGIGHYSISADSLVKKSGTYSLKFDVEQCSSKGGRFSPGIAQERIAESGEKLKISFWALNEGTTFETRIHGVSAKRSDDGITFKNSDTFHEWKCFEYEYTMPKNMKLLRIEFNVLSPGKFWLDDVSVVSTNTKS